MKNSYSVINDRNKYCIYWTIRNNFNFDDR